MRQEDFDSWFNSLSNTEAELPTKSDPVHGKQQLLTDASTNWREYDQDGYHVIEMSSPTSTWRFAMNNDTNHVISQYSGQLDQSSTTAFEPSTIEVSSKKESAGCFGCLGFLFSGIIFLTVTCLMLYGMGYIGKIIVDFIGSLF